MNKKKEKIKQREFAFLDRLFMIVVMFFTIPVFLLSLLNIFKINNIAVSWKEIEGYLMLFIFLFLIWLFFKFLKYTVSKNIDYQYDKNKK